MYVRFTITTERQTTKRGKQRYVLFVELMYVSSGSAHADPICMKKKKKIQAGSQSGGWMDPA
jgi:hypothetical protein